MAAVDALSLRDPRGHGHLTRWVVGGAFALALHGAMFAYLNRAPQPVGFESQAPLELDLMPPPSGEAQTDEAGAESAASVASDDAPQAKPDEVEEQPAEVEELAEIDPDEAPPPPDSETIAAEAPAETAPVETPDETTPVETPDETTPVDQQEVARMEIPPDIIAAPPEIEPAVTLPPETAVVAREEQIEPPKPAPKPVFRRAEPKPEPKREARPEPRREPKPEPRPAPARAPPREAARDAPRSAPTRTQAARPAERAAPSSFASQAGGRGGASANAGAARAAASAYGQRIRALVAGQKRCAPGVNGRAVVSFTVNRSGRLTSVSASGGGVAGEAQSAVRRASGSFPAMPAEMTGGSASYTLPMNFSRC